MRSQSYINSSLQIIDKYEGKMPLAAWLKNYFREHKKYGSKDRREISHALYSWFRIGKAFVGMQQEERLLRAIFLSSSSPNFVLSEQRREWNEAIAMDSEAKLQLLHAEGEWEKIFPFAGLLSKEIDPKPFAISHLHQPQLYLRIRPGHKTGVVKKLEDAAIPFELMDDNAVILPNGTKLEGLIDIDSSAVVQDLNSQKVIQLVPKNTWGGRRSMDAWDCCAASGGKSILLHDHFPTARITVSDIRTSILANLRSRLQRAGVETQESVVVDLSLPGSQLKRKFDVIVCDAPCSGSGTWARTPEQISFFTKDKLAHYTSLQKKISLNASKALKEGGYFLYITCSVFAEENEGLVEFLINSSGLRLVDSKLFDGYRQRADTLFAALFTI